MFCEDLVKLVGYRIEEDSEFAVQPEQDDFEISVRVTRGEKGFEQVGVDGSGPGLATYLDSDSYDIAVRRCVGMMNHRAINHDFLEEVLLYIEEKMGKDGAVLVFLPSGLDAILLCSLSLNTGQVAEITAVFSRLSENAHFKDAIVLPLHSNLSPSEQRKVFQSWKGRLKIILSTNIAETGVTIPDVVFVVDAGMENQLRYNTYTLVQGLQTVFVSRASANQRSGRAGRTRNGFAFRLYPKHLFETEMEEQTRPEMQRVPVCCFHCLLAFHLTGCSWKMWCCRSLP
jgi:ATP-dependent RNA helicase DHX29